MVLKANDRRTSCPCHDEFRGPRSDYVRQRAPTQLSAKQIFPCHEDHHKPRLPVPIVATNSLHATPQTAKLNKRQAPYQRLSDIRLRTVYQSRCPKIDCHPKGRRLVTLTICSR
ncbi:hypothetical protein TNCV_1512291 [Trichonephila clavipes]|nr:hypothetical protein TNCV_1512291 [Trichonephila clavipes]